MSEQMADHAHRTRKRKGNPRLIGIVMGISGTLLALIILSSWARPVMVVDDEGICILKAEPTIFDDKIHPCSWNEGEDFIRVPLKK